MAENSKEPCWYVVHTYSGYENKVKDNIEKSVENNPEMQRLIFDVRVPVEDVVEIKGNKRVKSQRKVYPGYVLVHMIETSESWYLVRNTRGVTGFVGPDSKPVALTPAEVDMMLSTQQKSVELAERNYNVTSTRYSADMALITDMLDAANAKLDAEQKLVNSRINIIYYYYKLLFTTGKI